MSTNPLTQRSFFAPYSTPTGKVQRLGVGVLLVMLGIAIFAPWFAIYDPNSLSCQSFQTPNWQHILGCNDVGQDILSKLVYGARISLFIGITVALISTFLATVLALLSGFYGGWIDRSLMRLVDIILALPFLPLVIVLGVYFGASIQTQILVITFVMWAQPLRELRAQVLSIYTSGFVESSIAMGAGGPFVGRKHLLPELAPLIVPQFVRIAHNAILVEASLSFLGLGDPIQNSWGSILFHANARTAFLTDAWIYWVMPPGLAIAVTVLAFAFIGFGFDASLGPRIVSLKQQLPKRLPVAIPPNDHFLNVENLRVTYQTEEGEHEVVKGVDFSLKEGKLLGLVGESGSGKTTAALSILRLLRENARVLDGRVWFDGQDLIGLEEQDLEKLRVKRLSLIPQSAMNALNPVMTIGEQLIESIKLGGLKGKKECREAAGTWLQKVGLSPKHIDSYPHELSGGMRQRAVIAIALCNGPDLVVADEPTTGLDVLVQEDIMALLMSLRESLGLTILFVTHNLPLIARYADCLSVMYEGRIVEEGNPQQLSSQQVHAHTKALFDNIPDINQEKRKSNHHSDQKQATMPLLELKSVSKTFYRSNLFGMKRGQGHEAVKGIDLNLESGMKLGLVGGSGAGKSTIARLMMGMIPPDDGTILYQGKSLWHISRPDRKAMRKAVHMVFQDPYQSLRNGMTIAEVVAEPLRIHEEHNAKVIEEKVQNALMAATLPADKNFLKRFPISLSGGQRQRVALARAIITNPKVIIADEPTSMLDQSIRMEIIEVMEKLREEFNTAFLFITHDISLAHFFCDQLIVLKDGQIVESGPTEKVVRHSLHTYTRSLIAAA